MLRKGEEMSEVLEQDMGKVSQASEREMPLTNISKSAAKPPSNSLLDNPDFSQIISLCSFSSSMQKEGVIISSNISRFNINFLVFDSFSKKESNTFVSTTVFIHTKPICFSFSSLPFLPQKFPITNYKLPNPKRR